MKEIKCNKCSKTVSVKDEYYLKRCPNCRVKDMAYNIKMRELKNYDKQSKKQIKELGLQKEKLSTIFKNYSSYTSNYKKLFKKNPSFDDYLSALRNENLQLANEQAERIKKLSNKKDLTIFDDNWGREVETSLTPQYDKEAEYNGEGFNLWGSASEQPDKPKPSHQDKLKQEFGKYVE
jgi:DNA-directed RNA polymerase subunit RPC12/RpoP